MSRYIDGFVLPLAKDKIEDYRAISEQAGAVWREHGALEYIEAVGEDLAIEGHRSFATLAGAGELETVIFAYIVYESREHRDAVNAKVMADPRLQEMCGPDKAPFDATRMAYGGFKTIVQA